MKYNFNIIIKKTNRIRTVSFLVKNQELIISVPKFISDKEIDRLILSKINWINKKLSSEKLNTPLIKKSFVNGEKLMFFGKNYFLKLEESSFTNVEMDLNNIIVSSMDINNQNKVKNIIRNWYIVESKKYLIKTNSYYEKLIGVSTRKLLFGEYKSKWGSCNSQKRVSYDWRIIMAPIEVIHYLVIHELCHIVHPNHSQFFWILVEKYMKDYKLHKKWLKLNSNKLVI
jgi:predicted metal-dependent hydrolase